MFLLRCMRVHSSSLQHFFFLFKMFINVNMQSFNFLLFGSYNKRSVDYGLPLQLKDMAERVLAVDRAAAMVEEMLKQGHNLPTVGPTLHPLLNVVNACLQFALLGQLQYSMIY